MEEIARDVAIVMRTMSNAYLLGNRRSWILIGSGAADAAVAAGAVIAGVGALLVRRMRV